MRMLESLAHTAYAVQNATPTRALGESITDGESGVLHCMVTALYIDLRSESIVRLIHTNFSHPTTLMLSLTYSYHVYHTAAYLELYSQPPQSIHEPTLCSPLQTRALNS